ncbi:MAG: hypothetical protein KGI45_02560 [Patescibacteria group bacterium]|nr:hypothetical protein [Patescibacteria group bacterium]
MKKITAYALSISFAAMVGLLSTQAVHAQMMGGFYDGDSGYGYGQGMMGGYYGSATSTAASSGTSTAMDAEELAGQALAEKLQAKSVSCSSLSQSDYSSLGEYYMSLMMGSGHDAMDAYIVSRYGQSYDDQMHIAMGERFSGCDENVSFPAGMMGFGPMMGGFGSDSGYGMMGWNGFGRGYGMMGWGSSFGMPGFGYGWGWGGTIFMAVLWALALVGAVVIVGWALKRAKK